MTRQPIAGVLAAEVALLGLLEQRPMHGYELYQQFTAPAVLDRVCSLGMSEMYSLLKRLQAQGAVAVTVQYQANRPPRKVYQITETGRRSFWQWLQRPVASIRQMRVEFLTKLFLARWYGPAAVEALLAAQTTACRDQLERLDQEAATLSHQAEEPFLLLVVQFRRKQVEAILDWLEECRRLCARTDHAAALSKDAPSSTTGQSS